MICTIRDGRYSCTFQLQQNLMNNDRFLFCTIIQLLIVYISSVRQFLTYLFKVLSVYNIACRFFSSSAIRLYVKKTVSLKFEKSLTMWLCDVKISLI